MTIKYDGFAFVPKRCDKCGRKFIFEWYNKENFGVFSGYGLKHIICKHHVDLLSQNHDKLIEEWGKGKELEITSSLKPSSIDFL